ncbi:GNAT family N-acetyltransferase [Halobacillus ihumii]|uniref:GNAT family N-acetyltransferase n=1 Tax=Halobacillus ihumii TaxID=2686092 RepID=UPI0013D3A8FE|nr:GNAT family N-acetyltransferase [Halobacillus ihumii]
MLFQKGKLAVRKLHVRDKSLLIKWLSDPKVLKYYEGRDRSFNLDAVNHEFYHVSDNVMRCIIEFEANEIGYIQYYKLDKQTKGYYGYDESQSLIYGLDQFIGEVNCWNRGIGQLLVNSMVEYLIHQKQADIIVMDPQVVNKRAVRCYEKCHFRKVKILTEHEFHEGRYRDCYLMEYQKTDFTKR